MLCKSKPLIFVMYNFFNPSTNDVINEDTSGLSAWPATAVIYFSTINTSQQLHSAVSKTSGPDGNQKLELVAEKNN